MGFGKGLGLGRRKGLGRNFLTDDTNIPSDDKELLLQQKGQLERRLNIINKQLE